MMAPAVKAAIPLEPYVVRVVFSDGEVRDVDIEPLFDGPVFGPLRRRGMLERVAVDELDDTITWPTGADLNRDVTTGWPRPTGGRPSASALRSGPDPANPALRLSVKRQSAAAPTRHVRSRCLPAAPRVTTSAPGSGLASGPHSVHKLP
jgi:hypothetical protein